MIENTFAWYSIIVSALLINNVLLMKFLGLCPFFGVSNQVESAIGMSMAVIFVMTMATAVTWPIYHYVLMPDYVFLRTATFILTIASLVQLVELVIKKVMPTLYQSLGIYLPLITTNCAILGVAILNIDFELGFLASIIHSISASTGFGLVIVIFSAIRERLKLAPISSSFKGLPIAFITASLMAMAFMGFAHLFGL